MPGQVDYTYDAAGRRQTMTATGEAIVNYTFDNANRLTQVAQGTTTLGFGYDTASRRTSVTLPNSIVGTFALDNANQLTGSRTSTAQRKSAPSPMAMTREA